MNRELASKWGLASVIFWVVVSQCATAQCPQFSNFFVSTSGGNACGGQTITITHNVTNAPTGSTVDWYIGDGIMYNPYNGEGTYVGSADIISVGCNNTPEVLYIMVNPDNAQVGSPGDQCDEFLVLWTGSGGFEMNDILISNLGPGNIEWDDFAPGNASTFSCGVPLPPGPIPENALLIIQSSTANNVDIDSDVLCASGLPVYIISYTGTLDCMFGYFDNNSACSSCPVMFSIDGDDCDYDFNADYTPPANSIDGWAWANTGAGVHGDEIPPLTIPVFDPPSQTVEPFVYVVPADFCAEFGPGEWTLTGILDPPPTGGCPEIQSGYFGINIDCGSIEVSGGGEVCAGNCPDNPVPITFGLIGTDIPYIIDIVVNVSIFPPFEIDDLEVTNGYSIQVCMGGIFPSFDPGTGTLTIPELAIGLSATVEVVAAETNTGCAVLVDPNSVTLSFIAAPVVSAGADQTICEGETVSLNGTMGGSTADVEWSTDGDGTFDDESAPDAIYTPGMDDIDNGVVTLTLTGTDENGSCTPATDDMEVTITGSFAIEAIAPPEMCSTSDVSVEAEITGGSINGSWETFGDGDFDDPDSELTTYLPGPGDITAGMVTLQFVPNGAVSCLLSNEPVTIAIFEAPDVTVPTDVEICVGDSAVININITGEYNYSQIEWFGSGGEIEVNVFEITYTPSQDEMDNQFAVFSFTVPSNFAVCGETTYNIPIFMTECDCPPFETAPFLLPICVTGDTVDLSTLLVDGGAGAWSITNGPGGANPAYIEGDLFITNNSDWGNYEITYTLNNPEPGCAATSSETIQVPPDEIPVLENDTTACSGTSVDISVAFALFVPDSPIWITNGDGTFINQTPSGITYVPGPNDAGNTVQIVHLNSIDFGCGIHSDTMSINYILSSTATFSNDTVTICNQVVNGAILNFPSLIVDGDIGGTWTNISGAQVNMANPAAVDFDGVAEGFYSFQYTTTAVGNCPPMTYTIVVSVEECACPLLVVQNPPEGVCEDLGQLALNAFIMAGGPGSWQVVGNPPGGSPAVVVNNVLQINGADPGEYLLRFTLQAAPIVGCPDSAEMTLYIQPSPMLELGADTLICSDQTLLLQPLTGGSTINLQWQTQGSGSFSANPSLVTSYTFSNADVINHRVDLIATTVDTFGFCAAQTDTIEVNIVEKAFIIWSSLALVVCSNPDSGSIADFMPFIVDGDINPNWTDTGNSGAQQVGTNAFDFNGVAPGTYVLTATTNNSMQPCEEESYSLMVTVEDCNAIMCPDLNIDTDPLTYCESSVYNLNNIINLAAPGSWIITQSPAGSTPPVINGSQINTANASAGMYTLTYRLTDSVPDCPASVNIPLFIEHFPVVTVTSVDCDDDMDMYTVLFQTDGATVITNAGILTNLGGQNYQISNVPVGQDLDVIVSSTSGLCSHIEDVESPECECTLATEDIADTIRFCPGDTIVLIPLVTGAQGLPFSTWITPFGTFMKPTLPVHTPGQYVWIVVDSAMCEQRDTFNAVFIGPQNAMIVSVSPSCPESIDGSLIVQSIQGGSPPYTVQVDNGQTVSIGTLPHTINNVGLGNHTVIIRDAIGCELSLSASIDGLNFGSVELGPDRTIFKGDSVRIEPDVEGIEIASVQWNDSSYPIDLSDFFVGPLNHTDVILSVTDTAGCVYRDTVTIFVAERALFYVPNIFSPNFDGVNDLLIVETNLETERLVSLEIYDRWGSQLYAQVGNPPLQWNGLVDEREVNPAVYVYVLKYKDIDGTILYQRGDFTVIR